MDCADAAGQDAWRQPCAEVDGLLRGQQLTATRSAWRAPPRAGSGCGGHGVAVLRVSGGRRPARAGSPPGGGEVGGLCRAGRLVGRAQRPSACALHLGEPRRAHAAGGDHGRGALAIDPRPQAARATRGELLPVPDGVLALRHPVDPTPGQRQLDRLGIGDRGHAAPLLRQAQPDALGRVVVLAQPRVEGLLAGEGQHLDLDLRAAGHARSAGLRPGGHARRMVRARRGVVAAQRRGQASSTSLAARFAVPDGCLRRRRRCSPSSACATRRRSAPCPPGARPWPGRGRCRESWRGAGAARRTGLLAPVSRSTLMNEQPSKSGFWNHSGKTSKMARSRALRRLPRRWTSASSQRASRRLRADRGRRAPDRSWRESARRGWPWRSRSGRRWYRRRPAPRPAPRTAGTPQRAGAHARRCPSSC